MTAEKKVFERSSPILIDGSFDHSDAGFSSGHEVIEMVPIMEREKSVPVKPMHPRPALPGRVGIVDGTYSLTTSGATPAWHRRAVPASRAAAAGEVPVRARRRHRPSDQRAPAAPAAADPAWSCANCRRQRCWSKT